MVIVDSCRTALTIADIQELVRNILTNVAWRLLNFHCVRVVKILADLPLS